MAAAKISDSVAPVARGAWAMRLSRLRSRFRARFKTSAEEENDVVRRAFGVTLKELRNHAVYAKLRERAQAGAHKLRFSALCKYGMFLACYTLYLQLYLYDTCEVYKLANAIRRYHESPVGEWKLTDNGTPPQEYAKEDVRTGTDAWVYMQALYHQMGTDTDETLDVFQSTRLQRAWMSNIKMADDDFLFWVFEDDPLIHKELYMWGLLAESLGVKIEAFAEVHFSYHNPKNKDQLRPRNKVEAHEGEYGFFVNIDNPSQNFLFVEFFVLYAYNVYLLQGQGYDWRSKEPAELLPLIGIAQSGGMTFLGDGTIMMADGSYVDVGGLRRYHENSTTTSMPGGAVWVLQQWESLSGTGYRDMYIPFRVRAAVFNAGGVHGVGGAAPPPAAGRRLLEAAIPDPFAQIPP
eukprot:CAMPEP_0182885104 /NCGR_PEP_ID=MMETSP0034_2-20130328/19400_1 /TAXON_ID=156128 /ORGANISM="Nephroselmis pyriformis, Strain CCMP717" /LENGTH=405 /DNA_ID=CAMNT_0025018351 /DNA_START=24 /DNA_END=1238 /DNA_ORIENTATION=+